MGGLNLCGSSSGLGTGLELNFRAWALGGSTWRDDNVSVHVVEFCGGLLLPCRSLSLAAFVKQGALLSSDCLESSNSLILTPSFIFCGSPSPPSLLAPKVDDPPCCASLTFSARCGRSLLALPCHSWQPDHAVLTLMTSIWCAHPNSWAFPASSKGMDRIFVTKIWLGAIVVPEVAAVVVIGLKIFITASTLLCRLAPYRLCSPRRLQPRASDHQFFFLLFMASPRLPPLLPPPGRF